MVQFLSRQGYCLRGSRRAKWRLRADVEKLFRRGRKIVGVDINPDCKQLEEEQISIEIGSQDDPKFWAAFKEKYPRVDILLDDGGHKMN